MTEAIKQCTDCKCHVPAHQSGYGKVGCQSKFVLVNSATGDNEKIPAWMARCIDSKCGKDAKWFICKGK